jgi:tyrosine-protein kinase Etk/Wzc
MSIPVIGLSSIMLRLSKYRRWLLIAPLVIGFLVGVYFKFQPPFFTAYARLLPPQTNSSSASTLLNQVGSNAAVLGAAALTLKNPSDLYASLLLSRSVQDAVIHNFRLAEHYKLDDIDDLRGSVLKRTKVQVGKDGVITLSYTDVTAENSARIANGLIEAMYQVARHLAREDTKRRMAFYEGVIDDARQRQRAADLRLLELEMKTGLTRMKGQEESSVAAMTELRGLIVTREVEMDRARQVLTDQNPQMQRMRTEVAGLREQLARLESSGRYRAASTEDILKQYENAKKNRGLLLSFQEYAQLRTLIDPARREVEDLERVISELIKAREFSRGDETRDLSVMQVLDHAVAPTRKSGPRALINAVVGVIVGLLLTAVLVLVWDILFTDEARLERWRGVSRAFVPDFSWLPRLRLRRRKTPEPAPPPPDSDDR